MGEMRRCFICGRTSMLERHHVFSGPLRKKSEEYGAVVYLCHWCHNEPPNGIHHNRTRELMLKKRIQSALMQEYEWTTEDFIREFGKNYLD